MDWTEILNKGRQEWGIACDDFMFMKVIYETVMSCSGSPAVGGTDEKEFNWRNREIIGEGSQS